MRRHICAEISIDAVQDAEHECEARRWPACGIGGVCEDELRRRIATTGADDESEERSQDCQRGEGHDELIPQRDDSGAEDIERCSEPYHEHVEEVLVPVLSHVIWIPEHG